MKPRIVTNAQIARHNTLFGSTTTGLVIRVSTFLILAVLVAGVFYSGSSASSLNRSAAAPDNQSEKAIVTSARDISTILRMPARESLLPEPQSSPEIVATYAADCETSQSVFTVGQTVCVKVSGVPLSPFFPRRLTWSTTDSTIVRSTDITTDPQNDSLLITATTVVSGNTVDNRGTWQVVVRNPFFFFPEAAASFTVTDPAHTTADLGVTSTFADDSVQSGSQTSFGLQVNNYGPDSSINVSLTDAVPSGASFVSFQQLSGPSFNCGTSSGLTTCTLASMSAGDVATFLATYQVNSGTEIVNTANVASTTTADLGGLNNSISVRTAITPDTGAQCTLTCPANIIASNDAGTGFHIIHSANFPQAITSGTCGTVTVSAIPNPQTNDYSFPIGTSFVTAESESGETCTFTVTVNDVEVPTISCPADITTFESPQGSGSKSVVFTVNTTDNSGSATVDCGAHPSGSSFPVGTTPVTCTATDDAGNSSTSCSFNVTVNPNTSTCVMTTQPPIVVNSDANACGTHVTYTTPTSDGSGTCGTITCDHPSGSFFGGGETLVTCTSSPDGGSTSFTVTVNDTTPPVPDLSSLPTITKDCTANAGIATVIQTPNGPRTVFEPPTATDNCTGHIEGTTTDPRVYQDPGTFTVHWTYTDASGNSSSQDQTIVVTGTDTTAPVPDVATLPVVTGECSATITTLPTATDDCDGTLTGTTPDPLTYTGVGTYTVHWTYTDQVGHAVHQNQTVVVTDTHGPTIALVGASTITVECHTSFSDPGVTTTDNCVPKNVTVTTTGSVNVNVPNTYVLTYTATDGGGNQASVQRSVIVQDTIPPTISCQADIIADFNPAVNGAVVTYTAPVGVDSCGATTLQIAGLASGSTFPTGTTTNTFRVTDGAGHTAVCSFKVTVALTSIIGLDSVTISGSAYADSYSSTGGYPATKTSLANILSNGTITIGGSGKVWGSVRSTRANVNMTGSAQVTGNATAGTTVTTSGSATVLGTRTNNALAPVMTLPSVSPCSPFSSSSGISGTFTYNSSTGDLTLSGVNIATLANGNYCFHNVTLGNSSQLKVNGPVVIRMTGTLNTSGATSLNNTTQIPSNLRILSSFSGSNGVVLGNSASVYALIYTPNTGLNISGSAPLLGTVAAKSIIIGNSGAIHYDTQLKSVWPAVWTLIFGP